jgi:hypothetical protein
MNTTPAQDLKVGDKFSAAGSTKVYEVTDIVPAHRSEYCTAVGVRNTETGKGGTVAFPFGATVTLKG